MSDEYDRADLHQMDKDEAVLDERARCLKVVHDMLTSVNDRLMSPKSGVSLVIRLSAQRDVLKELFDRMQKGVG